MDRERERERERDRDTSRGPMLGHKGRRPIGVGPMRGRYRETLGPMLGHMGRRYRGGTNARPGTHGAKRDREMYRERERERERERDRERVEEMKI
jgi:hypothetical protein